MPGDLADVVAFLDRVLVGAGFRGGSLSALRGTSLAQKTCFLFALPCGERLC
jgi:hypothetical protein